MKTENSIIERERYSGTVTWSGSNIEWQNPDGPDVIINLDEVVVIGEYTTDAGAFFDDWFLVFVYKTGDWDSIPVYAEGIDALKQYMSALYDADLSTSFLANSTEWRSYIRYPQGLEGKPLFKFQAPKGYTQPTTFIHKLKSALGLGVYGKSWAFDLTDEVQSKLKQPLI